MPQSQLPVPVAVEPSSAASSDALVSAVAQLRAVIDNLSEGLVVSSIDGELIYWNKAALQSHGVASVEEVRGQLATFVKLFELKRLDGTVLPLDQWPMSRVLRGEKLHDCRHAVRRLDCNWQRIYSYGGGIAEGEGNRPPLALLTISDVTESHHAELVLRESELRFRGLFEQAAVGIAQATRAGQFQKVNDRLCEILGYSRVELLALTFQDLSHHDDLLRASQGLDLILAGVNDRYEDDKRYVRKDGSIVWTRLSVSGVRNMDGELDHFIAVVEDIDDLVQTQQSLTNKTEQLQLALEAAELGMWTHDLTSDLATLDARAMRHFGVETSPLPRVELMARIHEDDRKRIMNDIGVTLDPAKSDGRYVNEYRVLQLDGSFRWIRAQGRVVFAPGPEPLAIRRIGTTLDITERRLAAEALRGSEERHRLAVDAADLGTWKLDFSTRTFHLDERCRQHHDLDHELVPYDGLMRNVHPEDAEVIARNSKAASDPVSGSGQLKFEYRRLRSDGSERWLSIESRVYFANDGGVRRPLLAVGTSRDVTDRKRSEQELVVAKEAAEAFAARAEAASNAKDRFLAALSHELRTPLNPVRLMAHALENDPEVPARVREDLRMIHRNIEIETRLIDDLLDVSRFTRGKYQFFPEPTNLHELLCRVIATCRDEEVTRKRLQIALEPTAAECGVFGDPTRLQQMFWNLLKNATKFTSQDGSITVRTTNPTPDRIAVSVQDTGIGIDKSALSTIFNPFEQGAIEHNRRFGGLGLGLAIVRALADLHGGGVRAASDGLGLGATFTVELPLAAESKAQTPPMPALPANGRFLSQSPSGSRVRPLHILVIEDHVPTALVVRRLLEQRGHTVATAHTAKAARLIASDGNRLDLILSDIGLPDGSGYDLFSELNARYGVPGIAISGYGMEEDQVRTMNAGFSSLLVKPITTAQLDTALLQLFPPRP